MRFAAARSAVDPTTPATSTPMRRRASTWTTPMNPVPTTPARRVVPFVSSDAGATRQRYCVAGPPGAGREPRGAVLPVAPPLETWRYRPRLTGNDTSRRVETPPRRLPPGSRARTNITSSCCRFAAGKPRSRFILSSDQPSAPVGASAGIENWLYGTAVTYTSAPCTDLPLHAVTWKRVTSCCVDPPTTPGSSAWRSTSRRFGAFTSPIAIVPPPGFSQLPAGGGVVAASATTAVGTDVIVVPPSAFCAVTRTRSVLPLSTSFRTYVFWIAPLIDEQLPPSV